MAARAFEGRLFPSHDALLEEGLVHGPYSTDGQTEGNTAQKAGNRFAAIR